MIRFGSGRRPGERDAASRHGCPLGAISARLAARGRFPPYTRANSLALDPGAPTPAINAAVESRIVSALKEERTAASQVLTGLMNTPVLTWSAMGSLRWAPASPCRAVPQPPGMQQLLTSRGEGDPAKHLSGSRRPRGAITASRGSARLPARRVCHTWKGMRYIHGLAVLAWVLLLVDVGARHGAHA